MKRHIILRNARVFGLTIFSIVAIAAVAASAAGAAQFTAAKYPVAWVGSQNGLHKMTFGGSGTCTSVTFEGSSTSPSELLTIHPAYSGCTFLGFPNSTITGFNGTGCDFLLHSNGETDIVCQSGEVVIDAGPCTIKIPAQNGLKSTTYTNNTPAAGSVRADTSITGIKYTMVKNNFLCPETAGAFTNGKYEGVTDYRGFNGGASVEIDVG